MLTELNILVDNNGKERSLDQLKRMLLKSEKVKIPDGCLKTLKEAIERKESGLPLHPFTDEDVKGFLEP
jgi:hypothetical protein